MKMDTTEITWYEDGSFLEWFVGEGKLEDRRLKEHVSLEEAIECAWRHKRCLYIQTAYRDAGLFVDYTE